MDMMYDNMSPPELIERAGIKAAKVQIYIPSRFALILQVLENHRQDVWSLLSHRVPVDNVYDHQGPVDVQMYRHEDNVLFKDVHSLCPPFHSPVPPTLQFGVKKRHGAEDVQCAHGHCAEDVQLHMGTVLKMSSVHKVTVLKMSQCAQGHVLKMSCAQVTVLKMSSVHMFTVLKRGQCAQGPVLKRASVHKVTVLKIPVAQGSDCAEDVSVHIVTVLKRLPSLKITKGQSGLSTPDNRQEDQVNTAAEDSFMSQILGITNVSSFTLKVCQQGKQCRERHWGKIQPGGLKPSPAPPHFSSFPVSAEFHYCPCGGKGYNRTDMSDVLEKSLGISSIHVSRRVQMVLVERDRQDT
ncbi:hypothetical protein U0070_025959 [Myodes glareolus]|uniref:Uncharacterized protein n=1 Tax=Myodes glareolus TaxID=447135 RepID=A0AAW0H8M4_MYOGA